MKVWEVGLVGLLSLGFISARCCEKKTVPGVSTKAGTYVLVSNTDPVPDFCLGGCVYTKEDDPRPGTNYCFQDGEGNVTCSGTSCGAGGGGGVEGWIEKYFEKECSIHINSVLQVYVYKDWQFQRQCGPGSWNVFDVTLEVFDNPRCEGKPQHETQTGNKTVSYFLTKVKNTEGWSVQASKDGYETQCKTIGIMIPFQANYQTVSMKEVKIETERVTTASVDFSFDFTTELLPDVFIQSTPSYCTNNTYGPVRSATKSKQKSQQPWKKKSNSRKKPKKNPDYDFFPKNPAKAQSKSWGSGSGGGGCYGVGGSYGGCNWKCNPTCVYSSWSTDPDVFPCECKGVVGGGLNYSRLDLPSQAAPTGQASAQGSIAWYEEDSIPPHYYPHKYFLAYAEFTRRNNSDVRVCDSKLVINWSSSNTTEMVSKEVPCFSMPVPPTTMLPTYPTTQGGNTEQGPTTNSPQSGSGSSTSGPPVQGYGSMLPIDSFPSDYGSGSFLPWPTSYPQWLTTVNHQDMFTEAEGVLIYGGGDRYWLVGCMAEYPQHRFVTFTVDFFTVKDPYTTPEFCGCIVNTLEDKPPMASKDLVQDCYVKAITAGPAPRTARTAKRHTIPMRIAKHLTKKEKKKLKKQGIKISNNLKKRRSHKKDTRKRKALKNLRKRLRKIKKKSAPFPGRSKRDISYEELFDETDMIEEEVALNAEVDDVFDDNGDYEENIENDYEYDYEDDYNLSSDWE